MAAMTTRILAQWVGEGRKGVVGLVPRLASRALATQAGTTETVKSVTNLSDVPENVTSRQVKCCCCCFRKRKEQKRKRRILILVLPNLRLTLVLLFHVCFLEA